MSLDVQLLTNDKLYAGWKEVHIGRSIESVSGYFELTVTDRWPLQRQRREIKPQDSCVLSLGKTEVIAGSVDDVDVQYDGGNHSITVRGRDNTSEIVDSAAVYKSGTFENLGLLDIATQLCAPHNVGVASSADLGSPFRLHSITPGETIYETLELLARQRGVLLIPDNGNLLFSQPGTELLPTALKTGSNILTGSVQRSRRERFARYTVYGQSQGFDDTSGSFSSAAKGEATDQAIRSNRQKIIVAEGSANSADCEKRAVWARNTAAGRSERAVYTVPGWTYNKTDLWPINKLVRVDDDIANVHRELLIVSVAYTQGEEGTITELTLAPREAYDTIALPDPNGGDEWGVTQ